MLLHQTQATRSFLSTLTKFDMTLTLEGTRNPNFNSTIKTSWDQRHCKNYQIPFPITIHGSKLELKQLRYLENHAKRINIFPKAITFYLTVGYSIL